ncbi:MAG: DMT family transporter [Cellvibrionaceae bacterium]
MTKNIVYVLLALTAFAGNSILCRYGLHGNLIDPASFTLIRLASGAFTLLIIILISQQGISKPERRHWLGASYLFLYAATFSFAYISLDTATGALILFGTVQITMIGFSLLKGQRLSKHEWAGLLIACLGFLLLTLPHLTAPSWQGLALMLVSGIGWALYTLNGKGSTRPLMDTTLNFILATPVALLLLFLNETHSLSTAGVITAIASGALASGLGYAIWYAVLPHITTTQAASSQLFVPVIAAIGGLLFLAEPLTLVLVLASLLILGGIYLVIKQST